MCLYTYELIRRSNYRSKKIAEEISKLLTWKRNLSLVVCANDQQWCETENFFHAGWEEEKTGPSFESRAKMSSFFSPPRELLWPSRWKRETEKRGKQVGFRFEGRKSKTFSIPSYEIRKKCKMEFQTSLLAILLFALFSSGKKYFYLSHRLILSVKTIGHHFTWRRLRKAPMCFSRPPFLAPD